MRLARYEEILGTIHNLDGIRIGGSKEAAGIGETDNPVLRHPITRRPYIPGSSLKGKLRSLLELKYEKYETADGKPCKCNRQDCFVCCLFGCGDPSKRDHEPTRLIFRDAPLSDESARKLQEFIPGVLAEVKSETAINRNTGGVLTGSLRDIERVPAGMTFDFRLTWRIFTKDEPHLSMYFEKLAEAFDMLEKDYLGGCGTRGSGAVEVFAEDGATPMATYLRQRAKAS